MTTIKVYAPNEAYKGRVGAIQFERGVAEVDSESAELAYFRRRGYGIGARAENPVLPYDKLEPTKDGEIVDARAYGEQRWNGRPLRDAAVDPDPSDFLPPTNAGEANPHGPSVVAPEIHDSGPAGIRPGEVFVDDTDRQAAAETALAAAALIEGEPADARAVTADPDTNMGPLGLSDPGSAEMGVAAAAEAAPPPAAIKAATTTGKPATTKKTTTRRAAARKGNN